MILFMPALSLKKKINDFHNCHKNKVDQNPDVISCMHTVLVDNFPDWPSAVLMLFAKTRTFIRIKHLNNEIKALDAKFKLRQLKQTGQFQC